LFVHLHQLSNRLYFTFLSLTHLSGINTLQPTKPSKPTNQPTNQTTSQPANQSINPKASLLNWKKEQGKKKQSFKHHTPTMPIARWAFNIRQPLLLENVEPLVTSLTDNDKPNIVPVSNLLNFLPKIECDRLLQKRLEDEMRRGLIGRLMIHSFFAAHHGCRWDQLVFSRSETDKPILVKFLFN
jgi:hypothetical protein